MESRVAAAEMRARIALATAAAVFVAGIVLVAAILPAEYGVDPLGTGGVLGLTAIAGPETASAVAGGTALEPVRPGANTAQTIPLKEDRRSFVLAPREGVEYKYRMEQGASLVYAWTATGPVGFDFHGEPRGAAEGYAESYQMGEGTSASGSFFAPTAGIHGWFWENTTTQPVTVTLTSTGFYASAIHFSKDGPKGVDLPNR